MTIRVAVLASSPLVHAGLDALLTESADVVLVPLPLGDSSAEHLLMDGAGESEADVIVWAPASARELRDAAGARGGGAGGIALGAAPPENGDLVLAGGLYGDAGASSLPALVVVADLAPREAAELVRSGVRAVLPNGVRATTLAAAVQAAAAGLVVVPAEDAVAFVPPASPDGSGEEALDLIASFAGPPTGRDGEPLAALSGRERDVLGLMAEGLANKQIAFRLGISEHTVKTHVAALFAKLHAGTRAEAVVTAARAGLLLL